MLAAGVLLAAYLLGSLPFSLWVGRLHGLDIRKQGSGNLGATNVYRVLGWKLGVLVLLLDIGKGLGAVLLARAVSVSGALTTGAALAAVLGHMVTPFAGWKGGKGVATALGVFLGLAPLAAGMSFLVWASTLALAGWVSVASVVAALLLPGFVFLTRDDLGPRFPWAFGLAVMIGLLVALRHGKNWERLRRGTEQRIWEKHPETPETRAVRPGGSP